MYAPFQAWITERVINNPYRKQSGITDYDPVYKGNVSGGELPISDPGQLGRANLPGMHMASNLWDEHLDPSLPAADTLPTVIPRFTRWLAFRGGMYQPFTFTAVAEEHENYQPAGTPTAPMGTTGAGAFDTSIEEHGPATTDDLESGAGVRQPRRLRQRQFLRSLFMLPNSGRTLDPTGTRDERILPQTGEDSKDVYKPTDASVGAGNSFVIPDVRRTFDQPRDGGPSMPRDANGNPIYDKAGYRLTHDAMQESPYRIDTSHSYPNFNIGTERAVGDSANRVRAGVQYDIELTRPSVMPHWFYFRPFDKDIAEGNLALKGMLRPPSVSRPVMVELDQPSIPWAAGRRYTSPPAGMTAIAVQPNINRQQPQSWDTNLFAESIGGIDARQSRWRMS